MFGMKQSKGGKTGGSGFAGIVLLAGITGFNPTSGALALDIHSVTVDRTAQKVVVRGEGFSGATDFSFGGVPVPSTNLSASEQEIAFGPELGAAAPWRGSYRLLAESAGDAAGFSVYISEAIIDPTPPPPPPPGGPDCPCIAAWEASDFPRDNFTWCTYGADGNQSFIIGVRDSFTISALFDPDNIVFDAANPGNSTSICALDDNGAYLVAEPVVNQDQYSDCENWFWRNVCL